MRLFVEQEINLLRFNYIYILTNRLKPTGRLTNGGPRALNVQIPKCNSPVEKRHLSRRGKQARPGGVYIGASLSQQPFFTVEVNGAGMDTGVEALKVQLAVEKRYFTQAANASGGLGQNNVNRQNQDLLRRRIRLA
jgi:hypothetical protein